MSVNLKFLIYPSPSLTFGNHKFVTNVCEFPSVLSTSSIVLGSPGSSDGKETTYNTGNPSSISQSERPPEGNGNPPQYSWLENPLDREALAGYSPWGSKELDMTEQLSTGRTTYEF